MCGFTILSGHKPPIRVNKLYIITKVYNHLIYNIMNHVLK